MWHGLKNETRSKFVGASGKIALPLIFLAAVCCRDQALNAVDYIRPSWIVCQVLSFPIGWVSTWAATMVFGPPTIRHEPGAELIAFVAACAGTVLNIYLLAFGIGSLYRKMAKAKRGAQTVIAGAG